MDVRAQLIGYPKIGPNRELKWAMEKMWSGRMEADAFAARVAELRQAHLDEQRDAIGSAVDDYFLYDEVLETAMMLGVSSWTDDAFGVLTALSRGTPEREAWEMTKWFDTNYHYVVPEISAPVESLRPLPWREPVDPSAAWAILGPYSLVKLSKLDGVEARELAAAAGAAIWAWVGQQPGLRLLLDEPCLGLVMTDDDIAIRDAAYDGADQLDLAEPPLVAVQVPVEQVAALRGTPAWEAQPEHVVAVMDGRSVWPDSFEVAAAALQGLDDGKLVRLVPSTSLALLPYTVEGEDLPAGFQFAREKARALGAWPDALASGRAPSACRSWPRPPPSPSRSPSTCGGPPRTRPRSR
jgi:5-methyltetrahydropteroyltriglutamate--homocysteine methyltransferase